MIYGEVLVGNRRL